jgi:UDP-N-acetylglucosamine--N-acetylmuramyl-(pentapeptide) pyrophosphoryl-undecaprenol N-acetylglucosamine transferase
VTQSLVLLCAGGTGGHLFPAEALAAALKRRGFEVDLATDLRGAPFARGFPAREVHAISSETVRSRSPLSMVTTGWKLARGGLAAFTMLGRIKPVVVVGFGGYPTVPPVIAATLRRIPTLIHEQNAVMGRANRMLASRVTRIATGFPEVKLIEPEHRPKLVHTGNPVRPAVLAAAATPFPDLGGRINLLVFGGSQGARVMSDIVPPAIAKLEPELRARLHLVQQARQEDIARVREAYRACGVEAEVAPFFKDLPSRIGAAHFVIARGGASTVAELAVIGRPSILVPLPGSLDQDQAANARALAATGGAKVVMQTDFTPDNLTVDLTMILSDAEGLRRSGEAARRAGSADAAERLADLVVKLAAR